MTMLHLLMLIVLAPRGQEPVRPAVPPKLPAIQDVSWMRGCWTTAPDGDTHEYWFEAGNDALIGVNRSVKGGTLASYEFMLIRATAAGLSFTAKPSGQPEATFVATAAAPREVVFANPSHDFPQRVIYRAGELDTLRARVEGTRNGQPRGVDFAFRRMPCPSS